VYLDSAFRSGETENREAFLGRRNHWKFRGVKEEKQKSERERESE
jgi:hypothetical protein